LTFTFEEKELDNIESFLPKPILFDSDKSYPYDKLNPFVFEDLTYFTIKQVIQNEGDWRGCDEIKLLGGIKDFGRDCILKSRGFLIGVIQCKHSEKTAPLSKTKFAKELIKFLLYSLNSPELIPNLKTFKYFLFSSSGVAANTQKLIEDFNIQIFAEASLEKWVDDVIKQHASLVDFTNYINVKDILDPILKEINVEQVTIKDFDLQLTKDFNTNIIRRFFSVKPIIDEAAFEEILDKKFDSSLSYSDTINLIKSASKDLDEVDNFFGSIDGTHIERKETTQLYNWVLNDLSIKKKNLAVLEANAGLGKTVVFRDLSEKLRANNIPVLGIKADRYYADNRVSLAAKLFQKANIEIEGIVTQLTKEHQKIVVLIDQLDALSQTLSTNRDFLNTYNRLIDDLLKFREIRIVISVRTFDLNYDSDLGVYKSTEYNQFKLDLLRKEDVIKVLNFYEVKNQSDKFIELLRTPSHLNIFCKLSEKQDYNTDGLKTLNDLHNALWDELVSDSNKRHLATKNLLHEIARKMYATQRITITNIFKDAFSNELEFLKSKNIIAEDNKGIHFFHQSFYDYVFSRQFVERGESLRNYLEQNGQSLYVRQVVKMVAEYLREFDSLNYLQTIKKIVLGKKYRFHIKMLLITTLAYVNSPSNQEKNFVNKIIIPNFSYNEVFLSSVVSRGWIKFLMEQNILFQSLYPQQKVRHFLVSALRKSKVGGQIVQYLGFKTYDEEREIHWNLVFRVLLNNINSSLDLIIDFLKGIAESELGKNLIQRILTHVDNWDNKGLLDLFDSYFPYIESSEKKYDNFWFYQILKKISKDNPIFVFEKLEPILMKVFETYDLSADLSYEQKSALEEIEKENPRSTFEFLFQLMNKIIEKYKIEDWLDEINTPLYKSKYFCEMGIRGNVNDDADDIIFAILEKFIARQAKVDKKYVTNFYESNKDSDSIPVLMLCIIGLTEDPKYFYNQAFEIIHKIYSKNGFKDYDNKLQLLVRVLLGKTFCHFNPSQIESIIDMLFTVGHPREYAIFKDEDKKSHILNFQGKKQFLYLKAIPLPEIRKYNRLNRRYQELKRKFPKIKEKRLDESRMISYAVGPPLKQSAYKNMSYKHWKSSMLKYGDDYIGDRHSHPSKGGKHQHAQAFKSQVSKKPKDLFNLIEEIVPIKNISVDYTVYGIWGLVEGKYNPKKVLTLYKKLIELELDEGNTLHSIWFVNYLLEHELIDNQIFDYLSDLALNYKNSPRKISPPNLERESLNTVRSSAIIKVILCSYDSRFGDSIFDVVERAVKDSNAVLNVGILGKIAYLNRLDIDRAFAIFEKLTVTENPEEFKASFWSADFYKIKFFNRMQIYFARILNEEEFHENGIRLITKCWLHPSAPKGSYDLLKKAFEKGESAICSILNIAEHNLFNENGLNDKSYRVLFQCLQKKGDSVSSQLSGLILRKFKADNFELIHPFLKEYVKSEHAKKEPRYFFSYLITCSKLYPIECLELMKQTTHFDNTNHQNRGSFDKEPVQVVLSIYSSLNNDFKKNRNHIKSALNIFDKMLQNNNMSHYANTAINEL